MQKERQPLAVMSTLRGPKHAPLSEDSGDAASGNATHLGGLQRGRRAYLPMKATPGTCCADQSRHGLLPWQKFREVESAVSF